MEALDKLQGRRKGKQLIEVQKSLYKFLDISSFNFIFQLNILTLQSFFMKISYKVSSEQNKPICFIQHGSYVKLSTFTSQGTEFNMDFDINLYGLSELQVGKYVEDFAKEHKKIQELQKALEIKRQKGGIKFILGFLSLITDNCYNKGYQRSRAIIDESSHELQILFYSGLLSRKPSAVTISGKGTTKPSEKSFINIELLHIKAEDNSSITIISTPKTNNLDNYQMEDPHFGQIQSKQAKQVVHRYCSLPQIYKKQNNFNLQPIENNKNISQVFPTNQQADSLLNYYYENIQNVKEEKKNSAKPLRITIALPTEQQFINNIYYKSKLWPNGALLKYCFLKQKINQRYIFGYQREIPAVQEGFRIWKQTGINLSFVRTNNPSEAQIRIAFLNQGSYSYVGTDCLSTPRSQHTMNFGWTRIGKDGTAIHEIGHALGLYHEHQNPYCPIVWNQQKVIDDLRKNGNDWSIQQIKSNIFDRIPIGAAYSSSWDSISIMHYNFDASAIQSPQQYKINGIPRNTKLSQLDKIYIKRAYPTRFSSTQEISAKEQIEKKIDTTYHKICSLLGQNEQKGEFGYEVKNCY